MTDKEAAGNAYRQAVEDAGLNLTNTAKLLGYGQRTSTAYAKHGAPVTVMLLLHLMKVGRLSADRVDAMKTELGLAA